MKTAKKIISFAMVICQIFGVLLFGSSCSLGRPKTEEIYDRVVELIEASYELNTIFLGEGLPVYEKGSDYAEMMHLYYQFEHPGYEVVSQYAKFKSEEEIRIAAKKVYGEAYLEDVLYNNAFVGYAIEDGSGGSAIAQARYYDDGKWIYSFEDYKAYLTGGMRIYDYSTMKVVSPSRKDSCTVSIQSYLPNAPETVLNDTLRLVKQDDGLWYLDSFTG